MRLPGKYGWLFRFGPIGIVIRRGPPEGKNQHLHIGLEWRGRLLRVIPDCCYALSEELDKYENAI